MTRVRSGGVRSHERRMVRRVPEFVVGIVPIARSPRCFFADAGDRWSEWRCGPLWWSRGVGAPDAANFAEQGSHLQI